MKPYVMREYGAWSVLIAAFIAGMIAARRANAESLLVFPALALLANSKPAFMAWSRRPSDRSALCAFLLQIAAAGAIMIVLFGRTTTDLVPLLTVPALYLIVNRALGEHALVTEVLGFALLSLAGVISAFAVTGVVDLHLYMAIAVFFSCGVFKVKVQLRKRPVDRVLAVLALAAALLAYYASGISLVILLPLLDNLLFAIAPYDVRLKTTGWIEVTKSLAFILLFALAY